MLRISILTLFPKMFDGPFSDSIIMNAVEKGLVEINVFNFREYAKDKHRTVDDTPYGGGTGMLVKPGPVFECVERIEEKFGKSRRILLSPQGKLLDQDAVKRISEFSHVLLICGHYEGVDERIVTHLVDEEISIGDYVLTGGELPAMVIVDSICRMKDGVVGRKQSIVADSLYDGLLKYPQYTRPEDFRGLNVPEILLSGNHKEIEEWRKKQRVAQTKSKRPDLYKKIIKKQEEENWK